MEDNASKLIDKIINTQEEWKSNTLAQIRMGVLGSDNRIYEEVKWRMKTRPDGWPVWSYDGILCFAEVWNDNIKVLFPKGVHFAEDDCDLLSYLSFTSQKRQNNWIKRYVDCSNSTRTR